MLKYIKCLIPLAFCLCMVSGLTVNTASAARATNTAMLIGSVGDNSQWTTDESGSYPPLSGSQLAAITGDGQYTVTFSIAGGNTPANEIKYLCLEITDITKENYPELAINIDSVSVDSTPLEYTTTPSNINLSYSAAGAKSSRVFLTVTNGWGVTETEDVPSTTKVTDNISVTFTISGMASGPVEVKTASTTSSAVGSATTTTAAGDLSSNASAQNNTTDASTVDNSTTGDRGVAGAVAAGLLAACVAIASCVKRR